MTDFTNWPKPEAEEEMRPGKEMEHGRWLGKQIQKTAIAEYDRTWKDHAWKEVSTRQSFRRFANELSYAKVEIYS